MFELALAIVILAIGPVIYFSVKVDGLLSAFRGFALMSVLLLVLFEILPEYFFSQQTDKLRFIFILILGFAIPLAFEKLSHKLEHIIHGFVYLPVAIGLFIHSAMDGSLLQQSENSYVITAIILHRLPVGLAIVFMFSADKAKRNSLLMLIFMSVAMIFGYWGMDRILGNNSFSYSPELAALVIGSVAHLFLHPPSHEQTLKPNKKAMTLGLVSGVLFYLVIHFAL